MRYNVYVETQSNSQPSHLHLREGRIRPVKIERIFADTVKDEYERLARGLHDEAEIDGYGSMEAMDVTMLLIERGIVITRSRIYSEVSRV